MAYLYRALILLIFVSTAYSLFAFFGSGNKATKWAIIEKRSEAAKFIATGKVKQPFRQAIDPSTGMPLFICDTDTLIYTSDISEAVARRLVNHFRETAFFSKKASHKIILGKEPNNYVLFYEIDFPDNEQEEIRLPELALSVSNNVLNHEPLVLKVINRNKEVVKVVTL